MRRWLALVLLVPLLSAPSPRPKTEFAKLIERLSEPGGYFASDNLVSNETSYLHVLGAFRALGIRGGAYLGVGPEQGFSYIAETEPELAVVVDIRRDNMLLHLLIKTMFAASRNRLEYLCLLYGRPAPAELAMWTDLPLGSLLDYIDGHPMDSTLHRKNHQALARKVASLGLALGDEDKATLQRFHDEFAESGLGIRYSTRNRWSRRAFPTNRQLYAETDLEGKEGSYLATEDRWRVIKRMHAEDRIVPVVGDVAGPKAMAAIGGYLSEKGLALSVFYLSNVESYLFRQGSFPAFVANVRQLPTSDHSMIVRSWFGRGWALPSSVSGHFSTQLLQPMSRFLELTANPDSVDYWALVNDAIDLRDPLAALVPR
ncbi:MAG: hypothetical protein AB7R55_07985 [Gemmatimonadales bacterium]